MQVTNVKPEKLPTMSGIVINSKEVANNNLKKKTTKKKKDPAIAS